MSPISSSQAVTSMLWYCVEYLWGVVMDGVQRRYFCKFPQENFPPRRECISVTPPPPPNAIMFSAFHKSCYPWRLQGLDDARNIPAGNTSYLVPYTSCAPARCRKPSNWVSWWERWGRMPSDRFKMYDKAILQHASHNRNDCKHTLCTASSQS